MQDPLWQELYAEVQKKYGDLILLKKKLKHFFKHIKYYFPKQNPKVITIISEMDYKSKAIYSLVVF
jgi:hypothetical protein